jgi:tetratricopeptide (TPR) repeat protein
MMSTTGYAPTASVIERTDDRATLRGVEALYATGYWLHARERYHDAMCVFRAMILWASSDERGYLALGACHEAIDQTEIALDIYGAATIASPRSVRSHVARARLLRSAGLRDEAREALESAADLADDDDELLALVRSERGRS